MAVPRTEIISKTRTVGVRCRFTYSSCALVLSRVFYQPEIFSVSYVWGEGFKDLANGSILGNSSPNDIFRSDADSICCNAVWNGCTSAGGFALRVSLVVTCDSPLRLFCRRGQ